MARDQQQPVPYRGGEVSRGYDPFMSLHREMNRLFDDAFRGFGLPSSTGHSQEMNRSAAMMQPDIDVCETDKEFKICADLPGVSEQDVDVRLDEDVLTIKAERRQERNEDKESYHLVERSHGMFQRSLRLPSNIQADQVQAQFKDGVLEIRIPKSQEAQQRSRRIRVQGTRPGEQSRLGQQDQARQSGGQPQAGQPGAQGNGQRGSESQQPGQAGQQHH